VYVNLDRVDDIVIHPKDSVTELYFVRGENMYLVYDKEKIISPDIAISKILNIVDRSFINIDSLIKECNVIAKTKR
jgi:hypothetical protein